MRFVCLDFEATGTPSPEDRQAICEAAYTPIDDGIIGETWSSLCRPGRPMPPEASAVHHITDEDLADAPAVDFCMLKLGQSGADYYVAHMIDFERHFFGGGETGWICTYKVALRLWPDAPGFGLQSLRYYLKLDVDKGRAWPPHRAGPDSYLGAALMARILADDRVSVAEMVRWSSGRALLPRITFGEHIDKKWSEVPLDYLEWIIKPKVKPLNPDWVANAKHELKQRATAREAEERTRATQWAEEKALRDADKLAREAAAKGQTPPGGF